MSVCSCGWGEEILGGRMSKPQVARKPGIYCATCGAIVNPGELCVDSAWLDRDGGGGFVREHAVCHELSQLFRNAVCGEDEWFGGLGGMWALEEAASHAVANGDEPFWRGWLHLYEQTWAWLPMPEDQQ